MHAFVRLVSLYKLHAEKRRTLLSRYIRTRRELHVYGAVIQTTATAAEVPLYLQQFPASGPELWFSFVGCGALCCTLDGVSADRLVP